MIILSFDKFRYNVITYNKLLRAARIFDNKEISL